MNNIEFTAVQYYNNKFNTLEGIRATVNGVEMFVPISEGNRHYDEIMRQVDAGTLTIQEADQGE